MTIEKLVEDTLGDEVERTITDSYLYDYKDFKFHFARLKPTKEIYEELKKDDNWAQYDYIDEWDKYYPGWSKALKKEYEKIITKEKDPLEAELDFLYSDVFSDASANIAAGIITDAIKGIKNRKRVKA